MQWLISTNEPEAVNAPILRHELLQAGIMREIVDHLPWYKKTRNMDLMLAKHLIHTIRSGFERSFVLREMERLDISADVAERFLNVLQEKGCCRFGEPRYFYSAVQFRGSFGKGVAVKGCYGKPVIISDALAECLRLLRGLILREQCEEMLAGFLGRKAYVEQAIQTLAGKGLLMSCDSAKTTVSDYGVLRWGVELQHDGQLLSHAAWEERLHFLEDSFQSNYFQSRNCFFEPPIELQGDLDTIARWGNAEYFWKVSFKLQSFDQPIPINLQAACLSAYEQWQELRLQSPTIFEWGLTLDLRRDRRGLIDELIAHLERRHYSYVIDVTLLLGDELPARLDHLCEFVRLKLHSTGKVQIPDLNAMSPALRHLVEQQLTAAREHEQNKLGHSLNINGCGDIHTGLLQNGICLGHISDGTNTIEQRRKSFRSETA